MHQADQWENVYRSKSFDAVSWYAPHLAQSLRLIEQLCPEKTAAIVGRPVLEAAQLGLRVKPKSASRSRMSQKRILVL